jgi:hypothetical protein
VSERDDKIDGTTDVITQIGGKFMRDPLTRQRATDLGFTEPEFGFGGRAGVLGDVDADVVTSVMVFFNPAVVRRWWERAGLVMPRLEAGQRYAEACADFGREMWRDVRDLDQLVELGERVIAASEITALPLFAAWRRVERAPDPPGHAAQVLHILREHRGANHVVAITAHGLTALEAIMVSGGSDRARHLGFGGDLPDPEPLRSTWEEADETTKRATARGYEVLTDDELATMAELVVACQSVIERAGVRA